ncbi:MAG: hypothetical protein FWF85_03220 [Clostridiales bacterium]|nr:hypothetical protein [Clostridiales bacterium]
MDAHKKLILKIGLIFAGILLCLTFFSQTIFNFNLTSVVVDYAKAGAITRSADGKGVVDFAICDTYYAGIAGKIYLSVTEGETVEAGKILFSIVADLEDLRQDLDGYNRNGDSLDLRLQKARGDRTYEEEQLNRIKSGQSDYDNEIAKISLSMQITEKELADLKALGEVGAVPQKEIDNKESDLANLRLQYQQQAERKQKAISDMEKSLADLAYQIEETEIDISANNQEIERLTKEINAQGEISVKAENAGVIRQINPGINNGAFVAKNQSVMQTGVLSEGFKTTFELPESVNYLSIGDTVNFNVGSRSIYNIDGEVKGLVIADGRLKMEVQFRSENLAGGETAEIKVQDTSELYEHVLPNNVISEDNRGSYVLYAEMAKGFWGYEYYARRMDVGVVSHNNINSAIRFHSYEENIPVIVSSDRMVFDGERIRIVSGSDLIAIK